MNIFVGCSDKKDLLDQYNSSYKLIDELSIIDNVNLVFRDELKDLIKDINIEPVSYINKESVIYDKSDVILILPGGLGIMADLFSAITNNKKVILYNIDYFFTPIIQYLYKLYNCNFIDVVPSDYMVIENDYKKIVNMIREMN